MTDKNVGLTPEQVDAARTSYERSIARGDSMTRAEQDRADKTPIPTGVEDYVPEAPAEAPVEEAAPPVLTTEDDMPPMVDPKTASIFSDVNRMDAEVHDEALRSDRDLYVPEEVEESEEAAWWDQYKLAVGEEHLYMGYQRSQKNKSFGEDAEWSIDEEGITSRIAEFEQEWQRDAATDALEDAVSADHADYLMDEARREFAVDEQLSENGPWANMGYRALAGITDPVAALATVLIPGVGHSRLATGMARVWNSTTRTGRAARYALAAGVENAAIEAYLYDSSVTRRQEDIAYAAIGGLVLGGVFGSIGRPGGARRGSILATEEVRIHQQGVKAEAELDAAIAADIAGTAPEYIVVPESLRTPVENLNGWAMRDLERNLRIAQEAAKEAPEPAPQVKPGRTELDDSYASVEARVAEIKAKRAAIRASGDKLTPPVRHKLLDLMDNMSKALEEFDKVTADANLNPAKRANAEIKVNNAKRHFLTVAKEEGLDDALRIMEKHFVGVNPKLADFRTVFGGKLSAAAKKAGKAFDEATTKYDTEVDALDAELKGLTAEEAKLQADGVEGKAGGAAFAGLEGDLPFAERFDVADLVADTPDYSGLNFRIDIAASGNRSPNIGHRYFSSYLYEEGTGVTRESGAVAHHSVEEILKETHRIATAAYGRKFAAALKLFKQEQKAAGVKYSWLEKMDGKIEHDLNEKVSQYIETPDDTAGRAVREAASGWTDAMRYIHEQATRYKVKGYEFAFDPHYLPRLASGEKFREVATGWKHKEAGLNIDGVTEAVIYKGLRDAQPKADDATLRVIAKAYADNTLHRVAGGGAVDLNTPDLTQLRATLVDQLGISADQADDFTKGLQAARDADKLSGRLKQRLNMDMNAELKVVKPDGTEGYLRLSDLFERGADNLLNSYTHEVGGMAAFARAFDNSPTPVRSMSDLDEMDRFIREQEVSSGREVGSKGAAIDAEHRKIGINSVLGRPIVDSQTGFPVATRRLLNYNFINDMGLVPITQAGETGNIFSFASMKTMWQHKGIKALMQRITGKEETEHLGGILEAMGGLGLDHEGGSTAFKGFDYDANGKLRENGTVDSMLYSGARVTARAMQATMKWQSGMAQASFIQELVNDAFRGSKKMSDLRMADLGMSKADRVSFEKNLLKYGSFEDGKVVEGQKFLNPNFDLWDDPALVQRLVMSAARKSRSVIQESSMGSLHRWQLTSNVAKIVGQFQSFVVAAWSKQLMKAVTRHDMEALRGLVGASATVLLANYARIQATSAFKENREDYIEKQMEDFEFFKTTLFRLPQFSIAGRLVDTAGTFGFGGPFIEPYRSSSLGSAFDLGANPTGRRWFGAAEATSSMLTMATTGDGEFSKKELRQLRNLFPFQSLPPVSFLLNAGEAAFDLPKSNGLKGSKY